MENECWKLFWLFCLWNDKASSNFAHKIFIMQVENIELYLNKLL